MADPPEPILEFVGGCPDCGERRALLPPPLPGVPDDFDWAARDYDSFRLFMMQELAYRFPERRRWTPADMEVVIVELLAAALDRASHALDVVQTERFLDSARRPQSVRRLLKLIGYDATERIDPALLDQLPPAEGGIEETTEEKLERYWRLNPTFMEEARAAGPRLIGEQRRMVTLADHERMLEVHPLVARARARLVRTGAWSTILLATLLEDARHLDAALHAGPSPAPPGARPSGLSAALWEETIVFHRDHRLELPPVNEALTPRRLLQVLVERYRMVGSEVFLETAKPAPVVFTLSIRARPGYFRAELRQALAQAFSSDQTGFFQPGRLGFGEDLFASDIIEQAMTVEGVEVACLNRFRRVGPYPDRAAAGVIPIADDEFVQCMNRRGVPKEGGYRLVVNGGEVG
jgi:hypothetical protein